MNPLHHFIRLIPAAALMLLTACFKPHPNVLPEPAAEVAATPPPIIKARSPADSIATIRAVPCG